MRCSRPLPGWHAGFAASPLFAGLDDLATVFRACPDWPPLAMLDRLARRGAVSNARGVPIRFREQQARLSQAGYEQAIHAEGNVATRRDNWHDFFNALVWLAYPMTKAALNNAQQAALARANPGGRSPRADALTLFDESGLVLLGPDRELADSLRSKQWRRAFWDLRPLWRRARLLVLGHSLLEKALNPCLDITGKCLYLPGDAELARPALDARLAAVWDGDRIQRPADLFPLPVFGVPGYHPGNGVVHFYGDTRIFRPPRC